LMVFAIHSINAVRQYAPKFFPPIPLEFNLFPVFADQPWVYYTEFWWFFKCQIFFCLVGIAYFLQSKVGFSLWAFFLLNQLMRIVYGSSKIEFKDTMRDDEIFGSTIVFAIMILWVGRQHWMLVLRQMARGPVPGEPVG